MGHVAGSELRSVHLYVRRAAKMHILNIVTSPRTEKSVSTTIVNAFLSEYREHVRDVTVDRLDIWQEHLAEFDAEARAGEAILIVAQYLNAKAPRTALVHLRIFACFMPPDPPTYRRAHLRKRWFSPRFCKRQRMVPKCLC
jgi:hypothetical protein